MSYLKSSAELKAATREKLLGHFLPLIAGFFIIELMVSSVTSIATSLIRGNSWWENLLYYLIALIVQLFVGVFTLGQSRMYMDLMSDRPINAFQVFSAFRTQAATGVLIAGILALIGLVCALPGGLCLIGYQYMNDEMMLIVAIPLIAGGVALAVYLGLRYSQCYYMAIDFPQFTVRQLFDSSKRVMKGNYGKLLRLYLSFIPLLLLSILSFGIAFIWLYPYIQGSLCAFYMNLMEVTTGKYNS